MTVHVECTPEAADEGARAGSAKELAHHIKSVVGSARQIMVHEPGTVARSEGKAKRVIDNRPKE